MSWIDWLEQHLLVCPNKYFFGLECPGCGMQRSVIALLKGNILESLQLYPGLFPIIFTLVMLGLHLRYQYKNGAKILQYSYIVSLSIVIGSFVVKQVHLFNP